MRCIFLLLLTLHVFAKEPAVSVFESPEKMAETAAWKIAQLVQTKKNAVIGFATGSTVIPVYRALRKIAREYHLDFSQIVSFNLDEYVGIPSSHPQSYRSFMFSELFDELLDLPEGIQKENIHIPNGSVATIDDLSFDEMTALREEFAEGDYYLTEEEQQWIAKRRAAEYEKLIAKLGPIDLQILGIGRNGHIGFAEPGTPLYSRTKVVELSPMTREDNARFFDRGAVPEKAISMGIATILEAKEILLLASGLHKAEVVAKALREPISSNLPATALRMHKNVSFFVDEAAAAGLVKKFAHARLLLNHQIQDGELWIAKGKIISPQKWADVTLDMKGAILAPGYIDLQINGGFGCDFSMHPEMAPYVAKRLPQYGVTSFLPTIVSSSSDKYKSAISLLQPRIFGKTGAEILGIHLEGPYFSPSYTGAHNKEWVKSQFDAIMNIYSNLEGVKIVTLAPERLTSG